MAVSGGNKALMRTIKHKSVVGNKTYLLYLISCFIFFGCSSSYKTSTATQECKLCNNGEGIAKVHANLYGDQTSESNIIMNTENFYVAIDNYPVFEDHVLIVPKKHYISFSTLEEPLAVELDGIINTISDVVGTEKFGLFEHGSNMVDGKQKLCGNSIYHAHLHFVSNLDLNRKDLTELLRLGKNKSAISIKDSIGIDPYVVAKKCEQTFLSFIKELPTKNPYLFCYYSNSLKESFCIPEQELVGGVPSQFFRKVFAEYFQKERECVFWNWKDPEALEKSRNYRTRVVVQTLEKFKDKQRIFKLLSKNLDNANAERS